MIDNIIAVDFDGTLCKNRYPDIGEPIQEVIDKLLEEQRNGAKLILWTCRCDKELTDAVEWCARHGIIFDAVNDHLPEMKEAFGNNTRKIFAHQYWDDRAVNILKELGIVTMKLPAFGHKLTAEQIKEALKCCGDCPGTDCNDCPCNALGSNCEGVSLEALAYIHKLETELKEVFVKVGEIITGIYNKHIFGNNDLEAEEKDAIINFSDDVTYRLEKLSKKWW